MLRADVVQAVADGNFAVYAVTTIDQAIEILCGMPAGERDALGAFAPGTVNGRVEQKLLELAQSAQAAGARPEARRGGRKYPAR
jgi:hypothetical protein